MDIIESNKLIAEFLGYNVVDEPKVVNGENFFEYFDEEKGYTICDTSLQFHYSWNHLMPVVERIRTIASWDRDKFGTEVIINGNKTTIKSGGYGEKEHGKLFFNRTFHGSFNSKEHTYKAVVEFIQWYNQNQTS